jgi:hypothetical protein
MAKSLMSSSTNRPRLGVLSTAIQGRRRSTRVISGSPRMVDEKTIIRALGNNMDPRQPAGEPESPAT